MFLKDKFHSKNPIFFISQAKTPYSDEKYGVFSLHYGHSFVKQTFAIRFVCFLFLLIYEFDSRTVCDDFGRSLDDS